MSDELFSRLKRYLTHYVELLNQHSMGDERVEDIESIIDELKIFLRTDSVKKIEQEINNAERQQMSDEIADEILHGKHCIGGSCED